jgi:hypothetical protein
MWIGAVRCEQPIKILVLGVKTAGGGFPPRYRVCSDALLGRELQAVADAELVLRIMVGLLFMEHGLAKLLDFPHQPNMRSTRLLPYIGEYP